VNSSLAFSRTPSIRNPIFSFPPHRWSSVKRDETRRATFNDYFFHRILWISCLNSFYYFWHTDMLKYRESTEEENFIVGERQERKNSVF
jgi:hypothetical protein